MTTCIIIDDEKHARVILQRLITRFLGEKLQVLELAGSVAEGVTAIKRHNPDLVFLDIEMPGENGFGLFDHFEEISFEVVFCTAYQQYAIDAFKVSAFDYLLKPVVIEDLNATIERYLNIKSPIAEINRVRVTTLMNNFHSDQNSFMSIALLTRDGYQMEKISNIIYCKAQESYCTVYLTGGNKYMVSKSLKHMESVLPSDLFFRIHKSYLVNMNHIQSYKKAEGYILLNNGEELEVASRRSEQFLQRLTRKM